jgi:hypothetical protein
MTQKMKKLFRFKYEPCNGTCYAHGSIFYEELRKLNPQRIKKLVTQIVAAHDKLCDSTEYSFGVDLCEQTGVFIGHFRQPARLDIYSGKTLESCVLELTQAVLSTHIPQDAGTCNFGNSGSENLAEEILKHVA